ncbi:MAG: hypothetical protein LUQ09_05835 [Methanomassiliicoccales archaeon]|nr:hypothetical protein [Methanomassiliicoccales archaeon]
MNDKDKDLWTKRLLCQWLEGAQQALLDSVGYDEAVRLLRPHAFNAGAAGTQFARKRLGLEGHHLEDLFISMRFAHFAMGREDTRIRVSDIGGYIDFFTCPFERCTHLNCVFVCDLIGHGALLGFDPDYDWHMIQSMCDGHEYCRKGCIRKGHGIEEMRKGSMTAVETPRFIMDDEEVAWFARQYYGEFWAIFVRCLIEASDGRHAVAALRPHMRQSGIAFALEAEEILGTEDGRAMSDVLDMMFDILGIDGIWNDEGMTFEVKECPFSRAEEIGDLVLVFLDAVVETLRPGAKVACRERMCHGDSRCLFRF